MTQMHRVYYSVRFIILCIALVVVCVLGSSCSQPKALTLEKVGNVRLMPTKSPPFLVNVQFYNPNRYPIQLKHADVDVYLNNSHLGTMVLDTTIIAPAKSSFQLPVGLRVDLARIIPNLAELLFDKTVHIKLDGSIKVGRKGVFINLPIHYEGDQVPDKIDIKLMDMFK